MVLRMRHWHSNVQFFIIDMMMQVWAEMVTVMMKLAHVVHQHGMVVGAITAHVHVHSAGINLVIQMQGLDSVVSQTDLEVPGIHVVLMDSLSYEIVDKVCIFVVH